MFSKHLAIVNCCSITSNREDLELFLSSIHIEKLVGTEFKLHSSITNAKSLQLELSIFKD